MTKGLQRSLNRGNKGTASAVKDRIALDLSSTTVAVTSTGVAIGFGSAVIGGFPEGNILIHGIGGTLGFAGSGADANLTDTWAGDFSLGTTPTVDNTPAGTDVDIVVLTAIGPATSEVIADFGVAEVGQGLFDNTAGDLEINLNVLIDAANIADDTSVVLTLTGTLEIAYIRLGDS